jgi:glycine/D-amino acid oxidase-like deaminating enzyme
LQCNINRKPGSLPAGNRAEGLSAGERPIAPILVPKKCHLLRRSAHALLALGHNLLLAGWIGWRPFDPDGNIAQCDSAHGDCGIFASLD